MQLNNQVNGLWIRGVLSPLELLTIHSFIGNGYTFNLWTYDKPDVYPQLDNLLVKDAREIIPEENVFSYNESNQFGHGKGSFAGFSDIFRYRLLYLHGGWWVDMDVTCLKRFDFQTDYVFRKSKQKDDFVVGNIMHVPQKSSLMLKCYEQAVKSVHAENKDWMLPINILNQNIKEEKLSSYIYSFTNEDSWPIVSQLLTDRQYPQDWQAIHWMNEEFRRIGIPKNVYIKEGLLGHLMGKYQLGKEISSSIHKLRYIYITGRFYYALIHFRRETFLSSMYYLGYNFFYLISDFYFLRIKPRFDIGKLWRGRWSKIFPPKV